MNEVNKMSSVCRVCLAGNLKLNSLKDNQLVLLYEKLLDTKFNSEDARPRSLCYSCYRKLLRCHTFSQMGHRSEKIFSLLLDQGLEATHENITELDLRMEKKLSVASMELKLEDEPISVKEEVTTEEEPLVEVQSLSHVDRSKLQLVSDDSEKKTDTEELSHRIHVEKPKLDDTKMTFSCNHCNKVFFHKSILISHIKKTHSKLKEKPKYSCNVCYKQFNRKIVFVRHMKIHTGEKTLQCNLCQKQFDRKSNLLRHMRTHTGEKPFACSVCSKQFTEKGNLLCHLRIHTGKKPFTCNVCNKQYYRKDSLLSHMSTHTGEKPFKCNLCRKQFTRKCNLLSHMRVHTGDKPFACNVCNNQFTGKIER